MRDDRARLLDIQEAIERIERYTARGRAAFEQDELIQTWVVHHIQIIGEASRTISADFRAQHPEVPWTEIIGMKSSRFNVQGWQNRPDLWDVDRPIAGRNSGRVWPVDRARSRGHPCCQQVLRANGDSFGAPDRTGRDRSAATTNFGRT